MPTPPPAPVSTRPDSPPIRPEILERARLAVETGTTFVDQALAEAEDIERQIAAERAAQQSASTGSDSSVVAPPVSAPESSSAAQASVAPASVAVRELTPSPDSPARTPPASGA